MNRNITWKNNDSLSEIILQHNNRNPKVDQKKNFDIIKQQMEKKHREREQDAQFMRKSIEQRFKEEEFNKKLDKLEKDEIKNTQVMYQNMLKQQMALNSGRNFGAMTQVEK